MKKNVNLPEYARMLKNGRIEIDADKFYPLLLKELGITDIDQYWLEVAYQCMKLDMQSAIKGTEIEINGGAVVLLVKDATKLSNDGISKWAQERFPKGKGIDAATKGKEARAHYKRIRGVIL